MADLTALYEEDGLQGIIPYAFNRGSKGYLFLCEKLKDGPAFWVIAADTTEMPYVFAEKEKTYFAVFSSQDRALRRCDELAKEKFFTKPVSLALGTQVSRLWKRYRDLGATHIRIDEAVWIDMTDLTPAATYDGFLHFKAPLRNARLNAALYMLEQRISAERCTDALQAYFWNLFKESHFYVPVRPTKKLSPGEALTPDNLSYHYTELADGSSALLAFTDGDFLDIYGKSQDLSREEYSAAVTAPMNELRQFMEDNAVPVLINIGAGDFLFTAETFSEFERISLTQAASSASTR